MNGILSLLTFAPVIGVIFIWARGRVQGDNDDSVSQAALVTSIVNFVLSIVILMIRCTKRTPQ